MDLSWHPWLDVKQGPLGTETLTRVTVSVTPLYSALNFWEENWKSELRRVRWYGVRNGWGSLTSYRVNSFAYCRIKIPLLRSQNFSLDTRETYPSKRRTSVGVPMTFLDRSYSPSMKECLVLSVCEGFKNPHDWKGSSQRSILTRLRRESSEWPSTDCYPLRRPFNTCITPSFTRDPLVRTTQESSCLSPDSCLHELEVQLN